MKRKMTLFVAMAMLVLMSAMPSFAQDSNPRTIEVTGVGVAYGTPDMAQVEVGVDIRDANFGTAFESANEVMATVYDAIVELGIAPEDIQTTAINVWFEDDYNPETGRPTGERVFHVTQSVRITVRDISNVSAVIGTAVDNGANQIFGLNFSFSDTDALEVDARETAVEDARAKAEHLAELMGVELGDVVSVVDLGNGSNPQPLGGRGGYDMVESAVVSPGQLSVMSHVQITFAIQ